MSNYKNLWNNEQDLIELERGYPAWIESMTPSDMAAIHEGGCASGAYMPAVTFHNALKTMAEHGNDVLDYIEDSYGDEIPQPEKGTSWSGIAVHYLSMAVELWVSNNMDDIVELLEAEE